MIQIYDNFLSKQEIDKLDILCKNLKFKYFYKAISEKISLTDRDLTWGSLIEKSDKEYEFIQNIENKVLNILENKFETIRIFVNAFKFGDASKHHQDAFAKGHEDNITALIYCNSEWDIDWGSETIFVDKLGSDAEIIKSVIPKPGRLLLYKASIPHCARVPNSLYPFYRYSMVFNLKIKDYKKTIL